MGVVDNLLDSEEMAFVSPGDVVFLRSDKGFMRTARANEKKCTQQFLSQHVITDGFVSRVPLGKFTFSLEGAVGKPYGTTFEIEKSRLVPVLKTRTDRSDSGLLEGVKSEGHVMYQWGVVWCIVFPKFRRY